MKIIFSYRDQFFQQEKIYVKSRNGIEYSLQAFTGGS